MKFWIAIGVIALLLIYLLIVRPILQKQPASGLAEASFQKDVRFHGGFPHPGALLLLLK